MELRQLQYFLAVAEQLSFSKAAELLFVTQPLLSQQIADLEQQLGTTLFNRTRRSVRLTPAGVALAQEAQAILNQVQNIGTLVQRAAVGTEMECTLEIGFEEVFERTRLTQCTFDFHVAHPSFHCKLRQFNFGMIMRALQAGEIDIGFTLLPNKRLSSDLSVCPIGEDCLALVAAEKLINEPTLERFLLIAESLPVCLIDKDSRGMNNILQLCLELNLTPHFQFFDDIQTLLINLEAGSGLTILPHTVVKTFGSPYLTVLPLEKYEFSRLTLAACWNKKNLNPAIPVFLESLAQSPKKAE